MSTIETGLVTQGTSKAHVVFEALREDILNGTIGPNERLVERDLIERFGVSKTPVREALSMLRHEGLVRGRYYRGMTVIGLTPRMVHDLYDLREVLEGLAAHDAAFVRSGKLVEELEATVRAQGSAMFSDRFYGLNARFHGLILDYCGNSELKSVLERLYGQYRVLSSSGLNPVLNRPKARNGQVVREHEAITAAIAKGDPAAAEDLARKHARNAYRRLMEDDMKDSGLQPIGRYGTEATR